MSSQRACFQALSNELIAQIFELSHVSDHFNLAMTCRRLKEGGQPTLIRHQKAFQEYNLVSDFLPLTIPSVLQKVVRDPYVAWNIRSIEIWGDRTNWDCWGSFRLEKPKDIDMFWLEWPQVFENKIVDHYIPSDEDLELYLDLLKEYDYPAPPQFEFVHKRNFLGGSDVYYKVLLILLCPRLRSLKHLRPNDRGYQIQEFRQSIGAVSLIIAMSWNRNAWAPGLRILQEIALGVDAGLWFQYNEDEAYESETCWRFTLLPRLESAYFGCMDLSFFSEEPNPRNLMPTFLDENETASCSERHTAYSSIEHIFLDRVFAVDARFASCISRMIAENPGTLLSIPKALKSLTLGRNSKDFCMYAQQLLMRHEAISLESLIEYGPAKKDYGLFYPYFMTPAWTKLCKLSVSVIRFIETGLHISDLTPAKMRRAMEYRNDLKVSCKEIVRTAFPTSSEVMIFRKSFSEDKQLDMECLEEILIAIVQCEDIYPKLEALFLEQNEDKDGQYVSDYGFSKLVDVAWERRIDVYVRGNTRTRLHELDLPEPPTLTSLERLRPQDKTASRRFQWRKKSHQRWKSG